MVLLAIAINIDKGTTVGEQWSFFYCQCNILDIMYHKECDNINVT
mgnify:CR=1 FL=1